MTTPRSDSRPPAPRLDDAYCELSFSPNADLIPTVRRFIQDFYQRVLQDEDITSHVVIATHELLENAVKYSSDQQSSIRVSVRRVAGEDGAAAGVRVVIETANRAASGNLDELQALLDEMKQGDDRATFYRKVMKRSAKRTTGSGLGIARLYAESEMKIEIKMDEATGQMHLRAEGFYPSAPKTPAA